MFADIWVYEVFVEVGVGVGVETVLRGALSARLPCSPMGRTKSSP